MGGVPSHEKGASRAVRDAEARLGPLVSCAQRRERGEEYDVHSSGAEASDPLVSAPAGTEGNGERGSQRVVVMGWRAAILKNRRQRVVRAMLPRSASRRVARMCAQHSLSQQRVRGCEARECGRGVRS